MISFNSKNPDTYHLLALNYLVSEDLDAAAKHFRMAIFLNPLREIDLYSKLENIYDSLDRENDKEEIFYLFTSRVNPESRWFEKSSYQFQKQSSDLFYKLALIEFNKNNFDQAFDLYLKAFRADSWVLTRFSPLPVLGEGIETIDSFARLILEVDPSFLGNSRPYYAKVFYYAGKEYLETEPEKTIDYWHQAAVAGAEHPVFAWEYGNLYLSLGMYDGAAGAFGSCLELHPDDSN